MRLSRKALYRCRNCSLIFLHPPVSREALQESYSQDYKIAGFNIQKIREIQVSRIKETCFNRDRDINLLLEFKRSGRILDLGCSWGFLMYQARDKGFAVKGVEVCRPYAEYARECLGLDIFIGQLYEALYPDQYFDAIIASHVLEHIPELRKNMVEMYRILKDTGIAIIISPNFNSLSRNALGAEWKWLEPDWHLFQFTKDFFQHALEELGFDVIFRSDEGHYGREFIESIYSGDEICNVHQRLEGSELIAIARK